MTKLPVDGIKRMISTVPGRFRTFVNRPGSGQSVRTRSLVLGLSHRALYRCVACSWSVILLLGASCVDAACPGDPTLFCTGSALYYDKQNQLLQIETLLGVKRSDRLLQDFGGVPIPHLTSGGTKKQCSAEGSPQPLARAAAFAIYYLQDPSDPTDTLRVPMKIEYVSEVEDRTINCEQLPPVMACTFPKHCAMGCVGCASYCCIN